MTAKPTEPRPGWVDPDDAPELTDEDFDRGVWFDGGEPIKDQVARAVAKGAPGRSPRHGPGRRDP